MPAFPSLRLVLLALAILALSAAHCLAAADDWHEVLRDGFDAGKVDAERWSLIPDSQAVAAFVPHGAGKAIHFSTEHGNVGLATRLSVVPPYKLSFEFLQPAAEAGGYRLVVAQERPTGNPWWFEFDRTGLAVWTCSNGGWAPRWSADGMKLDTWYRVEIDDEAEQVRFRIMTPEGQQVAASEALPHDPGGSAGITFRADSGGGLRGVEYDNISLSLPPGAPVQRVATSVDADLHRSMREKAAPATRRAVSLTAADGLS